MNWNELSEVCFGLVLEGRHPATMYKPEHFATPYDQGIEILQKKGSTKEDVAKIVASSYLSDASSAVHKFNGIGEYQNFDWSKALVKAQRSYELSRSLSKASKKLAENDDVDMLPIYGKLGSLIANEASGLAQASSIDYSHYKPFMKSGNPVMDKILGGIPTDGPIIVYGTTGVGKSHYLASCADYFLHQYPDKKFAIYTLEMSAEHYLAREVKMFPSLVEVLDRLYVSGSVRDIEEVVSEITAQKFDCVGLDDMDNMVKNSEASEYERVYRRVKEVCRFLKIPFYVLCQPNREAKHAIERGERFIGRYDVAWSGAAENSAALQVALQRVSDGLDMESETFPTSEGEELYYEIFWKSRDGWPSDYDPAGQQGPGSIIRTKAKQAWRGEPYGGRYKLWQPNSGGKKIGKKSKKTEGK
jgi:hypothetical protein